MKISVKQIKSLIREVVEESFEYSPTTQGMSHIFKNIQQRGKEDWQPVKKALSTIVNNTPPGKPVNVEKVVSILATKMGHPEWMKDKTNWVWDMANEMAGSRSHMSPVREAEVDEAYDSSTGKWDSDVPGQVGWNSDPKIMAKSNVGGPHGKDPVSADKMSSKPFEDLHMRNADYWNADDVENDELRDDYLSTTQQGDHEQDPMEYGVQPSLEDPMYDLDDQDDMPADLQDMGWEKLAYGR